MANTTTYLRMVGYILTITMHVGNLAYINTVMTPELANDPQLKTFGKLQPRYFTCWTFFLQIVYAWVGLVCDYLTLSNSKNKVYKLPKHLRGFRDTLFTAILWPSTWVVFSVFWPLYTYDRSLIYPDFVDKILTSTSNHIMHSAIVLVVLWEVCFQPRIEPRSHTRNIFYLTFHFLLYFAVLIYTYIERNLWIYPIFAVLYGTVYFPLIPITIGIMAYFYYKMQWTLSNFFWSSLIKTQKIR
ncbi:androgen-dependent TFPI-regulating protein-like [Maniola hyperantus]|uniref:androgen-dependent TFPI-regulating protein-like n=1 Tax=Aphantopus hyperantus TaxID=2795564 RepID=UPI0015694918|nr:androgen-dependent TFPI-regulating protein-like [Maniola hyperantus]